MAKRDVRDFLQTCALRWAFVRRRKPAATDKQREILIRQFIATRAHQFDDNTQNAIERMLRKKHLTAYVFDQYFWFLLGTAPWTRCYPPSATVQQGIDRVVEAHKTLGRTGNVIYLDEHHEASV